MARSKEELEQLEYREEIINSALALWRSGRHYVSLYSRQAGYAVARKLHSHYFALRTVQYVVVGGCIRAV